MIDKRLRVLQLVARLGTVTAAANALSYTPPAVSHQLKQLSEELGVPLLAAEGRNVRLTKEARTLLRHAEVIFAQAEEARADLSAEVESGTFTVCGFSTASSLIPEVVSQMHQDYPQLRVRTVQASPEHCVNLLLTEEASIALLPATAGLPTSTDQRFDQQRLIADPLDLLVPKGHPLESRAKVELSDAADEPWIMGQPTNPHFPLMLAACLAAGFSPEVAHIAEEWEVTCALVEKWEGVTIVPRMQRISDYWAVSRIPLQGNAPPHRQILSLTRKGSRDNLLINAAMSIIEANVASRVSAA